MRVGSRGGTSPLALAVVATAVVAAPAATQDGTRPSALHDYRIVTVVDGLEHPWGMAFLPGGDILVTELAGRLRVVRDGRLLSEPVSGVPEVVYRGQGGLLDVEPHPDFASNRLIYLSFSKPDDTEAGTTAVVRGRYEDGALTDVEEVFEAVSEGRGHYGSRLAFDGEGHLFITVGDRQAPPRGDLESHPAQDLSNHHGTLNRVNDDGSIPDDNPFVDREDAQPEIWSYGHRNQQGLAIHPETGDVWANEHGPQGGDELNRIEAGANYGWPVIGYGVHYRSGDAIHESTRREGMEQPVHFWVPSIATSGLLIYTGDAFPRWRGSMFIGGLAGRHLARLELSEETRTLEEMLALGVGRVRDVQQGPDGFIYLLIDGEDDELTPMVRLEPAETR